jgi:hypothetical protein
VGAEDDVAILGDAYRRESALPSRRGSGDPPGSRVIGGGVIAPSRAWGGTITSGPTRRGFSEYQARFQHAPEYSAAQAFAAGVVFMECYRVAGSQDERRANLKQCGSLSKTVCWRSSPPLQIGL